MTPVGRLVRSTTANLAVAREIAAFRARRDMTQEQVWLAAGIAKSSYKRYENGHRAINVEVLTAIAQALGTSAADILRSAEEHHPDAFGGS